jgi:hypothetical protein
MRLGNIVLISSSAIIALGVVFTTSSGINAAQPFLSQNIIVANGIINPGASKIVPFNVTYIGPMMYIVLKSDPPNIPASALVKDPDGSIVSTSTFSQDLVANFRPQVQGKYNLLITNQGTQQVKADAILGYLPMLGLNEKPNMSALGGIFIGVLLIVIGSLGFIGGIALVLKYRSIRDDEDVYALSKGKIHKILGYIKQPIAKITESDYTVAKHKLVADELSELEKLVERGIILEPEYLQRKQELLKKMS